jgi:UrcA family protein
VINSSILACRAGCVSLTALGFFATIDPTMAQRVGDPWFEIEVIAPRLVRQEVERTPTGKTELISLTRRVSYDDLDLKRDGDLAQLDERIEDSAKQACERLAAMYPLSDPETPDCIDRAVASAKAQLREAVAAAH